MIKLILIALLAAAPAFADSVRREVTTVDPASGVSVTRIESQADWGTAPVASETVTTRVLGAPIISTSAMPDKIYSHQISQYAGFPDLPVDGQKVVVNGVNYEYDDDDGCWEREDD